VPLERRQVALVRGDVNVDAAHVVVGAVGGETLRGQWTLQVQRPARLLRYGRLQQRAARRQRERHDPQRARAARVALTLAAQG
jgi:hypothetical protein